MKFKITQTAYFLFLFSSYSISQNDKLFSIFTQNDSLISVSINQVQNDSLLIKIMDKPNWIKIESILKIQKINDSKFWQSAGIGSAIGAGGGIILGLASYEKPDAGGFITLDYGPTFSAIAGGTLGALTGFIIGGIVGSVSGIDDIYDLQEMNFDQKKLLVEELLKQ